MIEIIKNKDNIKDSDVTNIETRVKAIIVNSNNNILLGHSHCEYQFPGGHVLENEGLLYALKRELKEETGLDYKVLDLKPYARLIRYMKDYPTNGEIKKHVIYYYVINDNRTPDLKHTNYTDEELDGNYKLRYIPLQVVKDVIIDNANNCGDPQGIVAEMVEILNHYMQG